MYTDDDTSKYEKLDLVIHLYLYIKKTRSYTVPTTVFK